MELPVYSASGFLPIYSGSTAAACQHHVVSHVLQTGSVTVTIFLEPRYNAIESDTSVPEVVIAGGPNCFPQPGGWNDYLKQVYHVML
ncbi:hypothetical protein GDO81_018473 [Engystomops pustulosus]|uniref:Uncharacterized protein n=1 Tax=Engystomops pustulosus TaxID=76066 RepID=A0AAV6ZRQ8_ENGPU|nr:hypothetical protein GDO81_018473 [Engystomops pustulosus]